ncbi:MAG: DUF4276 family protein [Chloroflexi bacterium CFX4]|nr:DUF4276 family protein [Chloroflexi bacterium CFX4]MDL1921235.1 DUF4276 family protein [Chloroflexi bacterium CFX3]
MADLRYTLVADGGSDQVLLPILGWLLRQVFPQHAFTPQFADTRSHRTPDNSLQNRLFVALDRYPCNLLFVHRDAEDQPPQKRYDEINAALQAISGVPPSVCVVPIRMTEAWLLFDEKALRQAAGNPNGRQPINRVPPAQVERHTDPKKHLYEQLERASELSGRHLKNFRKRLPQCVYRLATLIEDFTPLQQLSAFQSLEASLRRLAF